MVHVNQEVIVWRPETDADRRAVMLELNAILSSHHFRNSKRYPALLRYVVEKSIDGHIDQLKERTLGIEVFGRRPDYDTNADPVVRFTAGEIRKKIAQYYQEKNGRPEIQICLPLGSYAPQFTISVSGTESSAERRGDLDQEETSSQVPRSPVANDAEDREPIAVQYLPQATANRRSRRYLLVFVSLVLGLLGTGGFWIYRHSSLDRRTGSGVR